jgi:hypothetical protein
MKDRALAPQRRGTPIASVGDVMRSQVLEPERWSLRSIAVAIAVSALGSFFAWITPGRGA